MDDFLGTVQAFGFNFPPRGWAFCDGQLLAISTNTALFSLIGTTYGGDGRTTFALPDLRGRSIVHPGQGPGLDNIVWGQRSGAYQHTLNILEMPTHNHMVAGTVTTTIHASTGGSPINETSSGEFGFGSGGTFPEMYSDGGTPSEVVGNVVSQFQGTVGLSGGNLPFNLRDPYLGIYTSIALVGVYPSRN
ncbi:phage tail protein [Flavobacterium alkalisoli]|uniref:phage tail protein n=1 Tax=Flavobacterium alkalisoli TaxID=2602769 RepID=UPI003A8FA21A